MPVSPIQKLGIREYREKEILVKSGDCSWHWIFLHDSKVSCEHMMCLALTTELKLISEWKRHHKGLPCHQMPFTPVELLAVFGRAGGAQTDKATLS